MTNRNFPETTALNPETYVLPSTQFIPAPPSPEPVVSFSHYLWLLRHHRWKIITAVVVCTSVAILLSFVLKKKYEATAIIAVDVHGSSSVIGDTNAPSPGAADIDQLFTTESALIQSDGVLRPVAEEFHLLPPTPKGKLAFGVKNSDQPVSLHGLKVTHPSNSLLLNVTYRATDPVLAANVANAIAHSYLLHDLETRSSAANDQVHFMEKQLDHLRTKMNASAEALAGYEKELSVINPDEKTSMLSARLMQLNTEYTEAQNDRIQKQADYQAVKAGSPGAIQASSQAASLSKLEDAVHAAQQKMATIKTFYGPGYPEYRRAQNELDEVTRQYQQMSMQVAQQMQVRYEEARHREQLLGGALQQAKEESDALSARSIKYRQLKDEADQDKNLYNQLFRKIQEAGINGGYEGTTLRIANEARPMLHPVFPNKIVFAFLGLMTSAIISVIVIVIADMTDKTLRDPVQAETAIGAPVVGILPRVSDFSNLVPSIAPNRQGDPSLKKASDWFSSSEFYREAVATVLSCILLERRKHPLRSVLVTSAAPGEGKSVCISHMAVAYARQGFRTLLIDADLRRPSLHDYFRMSDKTGLANVIREDKTLEEVKQRVIEVENLDIITAGDITNLSLDKVGLKVAQLLHQARKEYDIVFIDAPPMLCFAEPLQIACTVDGVLIVSRAADTRQQAVSGILNILQRLQVHILGVVLNQVQETMSPIYKPYQTYYRKTLLLSSKSV